MGLVRHDMYVTLKEAEFAKGKAVEVHCTVRDGQGRQIDKVCLPGASHNPHPKDFFKSYVIANSSAPRWEETFCLKIPPAAMNTGLHLFMAFKNVESAWPFPVH